MRVIFALCVLLAVSFAFVPETEYRYKYEGRLGIGIPEIRNKYSGAGIKAIVTVQVLDKNSAIFKLSDIELGEYIGDTGIKITNHLPIKYTPLKDEAKILEEPYEVFFDSDRNEVLVVPKEDIEWVVNIRKSIAQLFLIEPIRSNFGLSKVFNSRDNSIDAFTLFEPTIFGTCSVDYAFLPVGFSTMDDQKNVEVIRNADESYYLLTRNINFDKCKDVVYLQTYNADSQLDYRRTLAGDITSRSSVMNVKLVGKPGQFVIQEGNVNGYSSVSPFGAKTEKLMCITNQTIVLQSTKQITQKLVVPSPNRVIKTLYTEVSIPFAAPSKPVPFINYYNERDAFSTKAVPFRYFTGIPFNPDYSKKYQKIIDEVILEATRLTLSVEPMTMTTTETVMPVTSDEVKITNLLEKVVHLLSYVDVKDLEQLFDTYYNDKSETGQTKLTLLIDVCAANGYTPLKMIVNEMKKGRITPERITSIFSTFTNSFMAMPILTDMMAYVKTLDFTTNPIMTTNVLINYATILKKSCLVKEQVQMNAEWYGAEKCDMRIIDEEFLPFLKQKFEVSTEIYQRRSIVQAMSNLGTTEALKFISQVATGRYDVNVREIAILGLSYPNVMDNLNKDNIFDLLMPIVHNTKEDSYLRQIAITVLTTYKPSPSWWQRLAVSTWREPSKSVGSFIYYLIRNNYYNTNTEYKQDARIAHFLLPMTKPYPPTSTYSYVYGKFAPEDKLNGLYSSTIYKDDETLYPRNLYTKIMSGVGEKLTIFESMFSTFAKSDMSSNVLQQVSKIIPEELQKVLKMSENRDAEDVLAELKKYLNPAMFMNNKVNRESNLFLRLFDNLQYVLPMNQKTIPLPFNMDSFDFLKTLMNGKNLQVTKYFDALPYKGFFPTELGLPSMMTFTSPVFFSAEGDIKFSFGGENNANIWNLISSNSFTVDMNTNIKFVSKFHANLKVYLPWNKKTVNAGVETMKSLNLPMKLRTTIENQESMKNISFDIIPTCQKEFAAMHVQNIPYVAIYNVYPDNVEEYNKYEVISVDGKGTGLYQNKHMLDREYTGLDAGIYYEGDIHYPYTYGNFYENIINKPYKMFSKILSPTSKLFKSAFVFNFGTSETKAFHPSISFTYPTYADINKISDKKTTGENTLFNMRLLTSGSTKRMFESNYETKVLSQDATVKRTEYLYRYTHQYPGVKNQVFCVQIETRTPVYNDYKALLQLLTSYGMDSTFVGKVMGGVSCDDSQLATLKGKFKVSEDMKKVLVDQITNELNLNKYSMLDEREKEEPIYDQVALLVEYKEPLPTYFTNMTYRMYDVLRGSQYPFVYTNYYNVKNPKGRISVEGERHLDRTYNLRVQLPTENIHFERFELPFIYKLKLHLFGYDIVNEFPILGLMNNFVI